MGRAGRRGISPLDHEATSFDPLDRLSPSTGSGTERYWDVSGRAAAIGIGVSRVRVFGGGPIPPCSTPIYAPGVPQRERGSRNADRDGGDRKGVGSVVLGRGVAIGWDGLEVYGIERAAFGVDEEAEGGGKGLVAHFEIDGAVVALEVAERDGAAVDFEGAGRIARLAAAGAGEGVGH